jgi:hypothetical protein
VAQVYQVRVSAQEAKNMKALTGRADTGEAITELVTLVGRGDLYPLVRPLNVARLKPSVRAALKRDEATGAVRKGRRFKTAREAIAYIKSVT